MKTRTCAAPLAEKKKKRKRKIHLNFDSDQDKPTHSATLVKLTIVIYEEIIGVED